MKETVFPLVTGGEVRTGAPLTPGMLIPFEQASIRDSEHGMETFEALRRACLTYAPTPVLPYPIAGFMPMLMAIHNILIATDPKMDRAFSRDGRAKSVGWAFYFAEHIPVVRTRLETIVRHILFRNALALGRRDVYASSFGATSQYLGRPEATGFWTRPRFALRREERREIEELFEKLTPELRISNLLQRLVQASPLTKLLSDEWRDENDGLEMVDLAVLSDDVLRGGIAQSIVEQGSRSGTWWGEAVRKLDKARTPKALLYYAIALCVEVGATGFLSGAWSRKRPLREALPFAAFTAVAINPPERLSFFADFSRADLSLLRSSTQEWFAETGSEPGVSDMLKWAEYLLKRSGHPRLEHERVQNTA